MTMAPTADQGSKLDCGRPIWPWILERSDKHTKSPNPIDCFELETQMKKGWYLGQDRPLELRKTCCDRSFAPILLNHDFGCRTRH